MSDPLVKLAYQALQDGKNYFSVAHKVLSGQLRNLVAPFQDNRLQPVSAEIITEFRKRLEAIQTIDWEDAERGIYPTSLLLENEWSEFFLYYPLVWLDLPSTWERATQKRYQEVAAQVDPQTYPSYYLQNFHHQTDGYLSDRSANLYDVQVDLLFSGAADAMRRRVLAPLKRGLATFSNPEQQSPRVLDVACGTGRTLKFLRAALPEATLYGVDLSPAYLRKANQLLSQQPQELPQLLQANAEALPYVDNYFHGLTCVFLFHELPASARQNVIHECFRVLKPGGVLVICDSIQLNDSPEFKPFMENFPIVFHEPYYRDYIADNMTERLHQAGFSGLTEAVHFASKYWVVRKPATVEPSAIATAEKSKVLSGQL